MTYKPQTKDELKELVKDENIYLGDIDTSLITDMKYLFANSKRENFDGIDNWDTSNVTDMSEMFMGASYFNSNINNWNVSKVTNMSGMFSSAKKFNQPLNDWDVSNVKDMEFMFSEAESFNVCSIKL